jgi:hypothetical protein
MIAATLMPIAPVANPDSFIARWTSGEGGQERANYQLFLSELCDALEVPRPDAASHEVHLNAYAFERAVTFREPDGSTARGKLAEKAHESGALGRRLVAGKAAKAAEARPVGERLGERHVGKIVPGRKQERFERCQRRPGLLAFWPRIEPRQNLIRNRPIDHRAKLVETALMRGFCAEPKNLLPNPPMRHDALQTRMGEPESWTANHCKHLRTGLVSRETFLSGRGGKPYMASYQWLLSMSAIARK